MLPSIAKLDNTRHTLFLKKVKIKTQPITPQSHNKAKDATFLPPRSKRRKGSLL
jgi:hypothetical protein